MVTVGDIRDVMEKAAPEALKEEWDNVGLQTGSFSNAVSGVLLSLDVTESVIKEAVMLDCNMIITHHPLIFSPLKRVIEDEPVGKLVSLLIKNEINFFCAHTNLDKAEGGVNDCLAEKLGLIDVSGLDAAENSIGRIGTLPLPMTLEEFALKVRESLDAGVVRYSGDGKKRVKTVALCSGGGSDMFEEGVKEGADVFVTGEVRHHHALFAEQEGISFVEAGHFETENCVLEAISDILLNNFDIPVFITETHKGVMTAV